MTSQTPNPSRREFSHLTHAQDPSSSDCVVCNKKHPLYPCKTFKALSRQKMMEVAKRHNLCLNCHKSSHYSKKCTRLSMSEATSHFAVHRTKTWDSSFVLYNKVNQSLHLTHLIHSSWHDGIALKACALLDSGSSTSFVSDCLAQNLQLAKTSRFMKISGIQEFLITHLCTLLSTLT